MGLSRFSAEQMKAAVICSVSYPDFVGFFCHKSGLKLDFPFASIFKLFIGYDLLLVLKILSFLYCRCTNGLVLSLESLL